MNRSKPEQTQNISDKKFNATSLQTRMVLFVLFVALVPLSLIATRDTLQTQQTLTKAAETSLKSSAAQTANSMDTFIQSTLDSIGGEAQFNDFTTYLTLSPASPPIVTARALDLLNKLRDKSNSNIISYAILSSKGIVLLDTLGINVQNDESGELYFPQVRFSNKPIVSVVTYSDDKTAFITFASRIININGDFIGVLRAKYNSVLLQDVITKSVGTSTDASVLLLDPLRIRMADSQNPNLILKSIVPLEPINYLLAKDTHRFLDTPREEQATNFRELDSALDNAAKQPYFRADITPNIPGDDTIAVAFLQTQPWTIVYSRPTSNFLADVQAQTRLNIILIIIAAILITIITALVVRSLTRPIISLTETANSISQGDLSARAEINTRDEIGLLADTFNRMSSQIQDLVTGLESRVEQRTAELGQRTTELEQITKQSEKRAN